MNASDKEMVFKAVKDLEAVVEVLRKHEEFVAAEKLENFIQQLLNLDVLYGNHEGQIKILENSFKGLDFSYKLMLIIKAIFECF